MKILVYGSKGWIGQQFIKILKNTELEYTCGMSRTDNYKKLLEEIENVQPTHIISFIGRTHGKIGDKLYPTIDYLEQEGKFFISFRFDSRPISKSKNIHYTYLGTGCIFKFDEEHPFGEEVNGFNEYSQPNFFGSSYSIVKGYTDRLMHLYENNVLNLRIRMPITGEYNPRNFITKITTYQKICSIPNSMTVLPELLPIVLDLMKNNKTGSLNLTNPGLISHNEILQMYKEIVDPSFTWINFNQEEQRLIIDSERSNNFLNTDKLKYLYPNINNIKKSLEKCLHDYKKSM